MVETLSELLESAANVAEDNLQLLCPNCHSLTENYGRLNAKSTRPKK